MLKTKASPARFTMRNFSCPKYDGSSKYLKVLNLYVLLIPQLRQKFKDPLKDYPLLLKFF